MNTNSNTVGNQGGLCKAVFLDRDGVVNVYKPYIYRKKDFEFAPRVFEALQKLSQTVYKAVIITNQAGIGRGYYTAQDVDKLHSWMLGEFKKHHVRIDGVYYCPHRPDDDCACRKPNIGLVEIAAKGFDLDLSKSWIVGDDPKDIVLGKKAGMRTIMVENKFLPQSTANPDFVVTGLSGAIEIIMSSKV